MRARDTLTGLTHDRLGIGTAEDEMDKAGDVVQRYFPPLFCSLLILHHLSFDDAGETEASGQADREVLGLEDLAGAVMGTDRLEHRQRHDRRDLETRSGREVCS